MSEIPVAFTVRHCFQMLQGRVSQQPNPTGLVVGCGNRDEVVFLREALNSECIAGLDIVPRFSKAARDAHCVLLADAQNLPCGSESLDFLAAFHSLEHVPDAEGALDEMERVLRPGAWLYIGVPNKSRLVGYMGSFDATIQQKIRWNLDDYRKRLRGRFENRYGAHAGFFGGELAAMLRARFDNVELLTRDYFMGKYGGRGGSGLMPILLSGLMLPYAAAAHYAIAQKRAVSASVRQGVREPAPDWTGSL